MSIDLIWLSSRNSAPAWPHGNVYVVPPCPDKISEFIQSNINTNDTGAWLFWDSALDLPPFPLINEFTNSIDDVWHAGLALGTGGQPDFIDYVDPTWMLNRDPDPGIEATSWRLSLRACLIKTNVLRQMGGPLPEFSSLEAAGLEMGLRYIRHGVFVRHVPNLITTGLVHQSVNLPLQDQLRFLLAGYGKTWTRWACVRTVLSGETSITQILRAWRKNRTTGSKSRVKPYQRPKLSEPSGRVEGRVTVLIPTVNRYPYLRVLLAQLREQSVRPFEILVIDQTPTEERDVHLAQDFSDLPIQFLFMDQAGQCSSRNLGLAYAHGDYILFLDDDEEIARDFIRHHLINISVFKTNASSGIVTEVRSDPIPYHFSFIRISDVFPAGNSLINYTVLRKSGLFDLAYDRGQRADGDLGMRIYLSGERMILNPEITILHHHAPQGGLRTHKARVNTHAASRKKISLRVLPSVSDIYLSRRYFSPRQVREMLWISVLGTFSIHGPWWKKMFKALLSFVALPSTVWRIRRRYQAVTMML
ncbi:MAG TPA: glycosyltransferase family A protein, partial [Anaerolinea sp.]|nr:glycosyltransferase family A protein [Anaerolinea sp.]